ncbi:MAG: hypothetical protein ACUVRO_04110 [Armatimonadota bacterium]
MGVKVIFDHDTIEDRGFDPVPAGVYTARIDTTKSETRTNVNGKPYVPIYFTIEEPQEYAGRQVVENFYITREAMFLLHRLFRDFGLLTQQQGRETRDIDELHGRLCRISVRVGANADGSARNDVDSIVPIKDGQPSVAAGAKGKKLPW